ncbi:MAG TPA: calcium/sodium antiporter [Acidimicrobiia bacterium]|nr:calcium/sodium antiporter [Acidimicrobiia bacterium]
MILAVSALVAGLVLLTLGADRFVAASARIARRLGVSTVLVGALVVGLGTSAPELMVSILAAGRGEVDIALGNVIGSNTANMTLVLGSTALVAPIVSQVRTIRREGFTMFFALVVISILLWDLGLVRWEAAGLAVGMLVAAVLLVRWSPLDRTATTVDLIPGEDVWTGTLGREALIGVATLGLTLLGAELLVRGAGRLAEEAGISSAFVGLVIVSVGTSLPELATAIASARRNETDLVLGNVVGSNLFNTLAVAGTAGLVGPGLVDPSFRNALGFMLAAAVLAGLFVLSGRRVERWQGTVLLALFMGFVAIAA